MWKYSPIETRKCQKSKNYFIDFQKTCKNYLTFNKITLKFKIVR